jgi:hypothetical protein
MNKEKNKSPPPYNKYILIKMGESGGVSYNV